MINRLGQNISKQINNIKAFQMKCGWESMQAKCNSAAAMVCYSVSILEMIRPQGRTTEFETR